MFLRVVNWYVEVSSSRCDLVGSDDFDGVGAVNEQCRTFDKMFEGATSEEVVE